MKITQLENKNMMKFYIFADITNPKLQVLFKLKWI